DRGIARQQAEDVLRVDRIGLVVLNLQGDLLVLRPMVSQPNIEAIDGVLAPGCKWAGERGNDPDIHLLGRDRWCCGSGAYQKCRGAYPNKQRINQGHDLSSRLVF